MSGSQLWAAVVVLLLLQSAQGVYIKYHGFQVQLESVKKLSELEEKQMSSPQLRKSGLLLPDVCHNPALPLDLQPICASQEAASTFKALRTIATDECELCINVACTGC
uniref:Guanylate cyclase activator 2B n=1 Tax=Notomys alexis TaxID=184396 RepID=GUC2B_NOTAL|nr:RecName: Full=Guanylate cyclase activator 2B; Contains: RecName: Full=Uroguanylin; Short=UGN; Flags: Precursor [Notomys alexis]AAL77417.1 uroguanylin [Notomys alexis]